MYFVLLDREIISKILHCEFSFYQFHHLDDYIITDLRTIKLKEPLSHVYYNR